MVVDYNAGMKANLYRNIRARDFLELFLLSGVSSLLLLRFYLYLAGYPQVGGGALHIAHMLWGGVLMVTAMVMSLAFLGQRVKWLIALVGGAGFGMFIDEIGKFITRDNNYFFKPTIGIIYAIFVILYLLFNYLSRYQQLSSREYQLNALAQLEEAVAHDFDEREKIQVRDLINLADQKSIITKELRRLLEELETIEAPRLNVLTRAMHALRRDYQRFWRRRSSNVVIRVFFIVEAIIFMIATFALLVHSFDSVHEIIFGQVSYSRFLIFGQLISSVVAGGFALAGIIRLQKSRLVAFEHFRQAGMINLLLTQFFVFCREQFGAMPGFVFNLLLLIVINFVVAQEVHRPQHLKSRT